MRAAIVLGVCVACSPTPREAVPPDANVLPAGVWEPDPGPGRGDARLVADGGDVWFAYVRDEGEDHVWLTRTRSDGTPIVAPVPVDTPTGAAGQPAITRAGDSVTVAFRRFTTPAVALRRFDRSGTPARPAAHEVALPGAAAARAVSLELVANPDGMLRLLATHDSRDAGEVVVVPLDAAADPAGAPSLLGTADDGVPAALGAAVATDGATLVAWDRRYEQCLGPMPAVARATAITLDGTAGAVHDVRDHEGTDQLSPAVAAAGTTALLAWSTRLPLSSLIAVARFDQPTTILAEVGDPHRFNGRPRLALADAEHGALAWTTDDPAELLVARLRVSASALVVDAPHVVPHIDPSRVLDLHGLVHVGGERYVVAWTERSPDLQVARLYATTRDLAQAPGPRPVAPAPAASPALQRRRCSH